MHRTPARLAAACAGLFLGLAAAAEVDAIASHSTASHFLSIGVSIGESPERDAQ